MSRAISRPRIRCDSSGELLEFLEYLPCHISLFAAQRHRLRMVSSKARR